MQKHAVLFDMDGLLLDTEKICLDTFNDTAAEFELPDISDIFLNCVGLRGIESKITLTKGLEGIVDREIFCSRWDILIQQRIKLGIPVKSGVFQLLRRLKAEDIQTAVTTSSKTEMAITNLQKTNLLPFFDIIIGGDQVRNGKPNPEVYIKTAIRLERKINECIVFEDSDIGVLAAVRSGAKTVQIPDLKQPSSETRKLKHIVAPNIIEGARLVGLLE